MSILISINAGADPSTTTVSATGQLQHIITDAEAAAFGIAGDALNTAVGQYCGESPDDAYLHSPTPWGDLYQTYNWPEVQTMITPLSATIASLTSDATILATNTLTNSSSKAGTFNAGITQSVQSTVQTNWSTTTTVGVRNSISYQIGFGTSVTGQTEFNFSQAWQSGGMESETVTVGTNAGVTVVLDPGQSVLAELAANRGVLTVDVVFLMSLAGVVAVNYSDRFKGHHFWGFDVNGVLGAAGLPTQIQVTETIQINYYANVQILLKNPQGQLLQRFNASDRPGLTRAA